MQILNSSQQKVRKYFCFMGSYQNHRLERNHKTLKKILSFLRKFFENSFASKHVVSICNKDIVVTRSLIHSFTLK